VLLAAKNRLLSAVLGGSFFSD